MNHKFLVVFMLVAVAVLSAQPAWSQGTISTGGIQGTVTDPQGAAVAGAEVTIAAANEGKTIEIVTNASGLYNSGALTPARTPCVFRRMDSNPSQWWSLSRSEAWRLAISSWNLDRQIRLWK